MSATNTFENSLLDLIFTNITLVNVGDAAGLLKSVGDGDIFVSLHTATLSDTTANQGVSEASYAGPYARIGVARTVSDWTVTGTAPTNVDNVAAITFATATDSETETDFGLGFAVSGATALYFYGALQSPLAVSNGVQPEFAIGALNITLE